MTRWPLPYGSCCSSSRSPWTGGINAQVIFETLVRARDTLQASDLVKNLLFQEIEADGTGK